MAVRMASKWHRLPRSDTLHPEIARLEVFEVELGRGGRGSPLLKTLPTVNRPPLSWLKGNGCLFPTLSAGGCGFGPMVALPAHHLTPLHLTRLATFWLVLEPLVGEEKLLPGSENELRSAVHTLQDPIPVVHSRTPPIEQGPTRYELHSGLNTARLVPFPLFRRFWIPNPVRVWPFCVPSCEPRLP